MEGMEKRKKDSNQMQFIILLVGIIFVAFNLRPAITSVGPIIGFIRDDIAISNGTAGLITSLPLIAFAVISPLVPNLARTFTKEKALIIGLSLIIIGILVRSIAVFILLMLGTFIVGAGIAICNVLLPSILKDRFPLKVAFLTSVYTTAMNIFAASASGLSHPLAVNLGLGWQLSLLVWTTPAILGIIVWVIIQKKYTERQEKIQLASGGVLSGNRMWKSSLAWFVAMNMGLQSIMFYVTISWLPEILHDYGISMETAGWLLSLTQLVGLPASFFLPILAGRVKQQSMIACSVGLCALLGYGGLLLGSSWPVLLVSLIFIGTALGGGFSLALTFIGLRSKDADQATDLSGMAQSLGYLLAAFGPFAIGSIYDLTSTWTVPLIVLMTVAMCIMFVGYQVGKDRFVFDNNK
ncbi:CynX/NimT family MFS transporter [Oceanobacillus jeddahense]|uniref:MFS transporter n=1 Tax=Oceanobacillus jeddahense TaxID=1462527 RepID=A0ABY5JPM9_9BACI|nr:MFS transporter [Oceanobacillus jeddahense]UUI02248.1 MFS transporter [Oceanobacillus jeddahense]